MFGPQTQSTFVFLLTYEETKKKKQKNPEMTYRIVFPF